MKLETAGRVFTCSISLYTLLLTLFVFGPSQIYLGNSSEFSVLYSELLLKGLWLSILCFIALLPLLFAVQVKITPYRLTVSAIVALCVLLYLQGSFIVWDYGVLDGDEIRWRDHLWKGLIDSAIWAGIFVLALLKSHWISRHAKAICLALIAIQTTSAFYQSRRLPDVPSFKKYTIDPSNKYDFSKKQNVIIIVLDSFQTDLFQEIINKHPSYKEIFTGFTYFRNSLAGHPFTETSTMNILTGQYYEGNITFEQHKEKVFLNHSLPAVLKQAGFHVEVYPFIKRAIYYDTKILSNVKKSTAPAKESIETLNYVFDISLFRLLPTFLKEHIQNNQNWLFKNKLDLLFAWVYLETESMAPEKLRVASPEILTAATRNRNFLFARDLAELGTAEKSEGVFKYYHFGLPHLPLVINEKLEHKFMTLNRENYLRQCQAALKLVDFIFDGLKRIQAYDNSLIFVIADHGAGAQDQEFIHSAGFPQPPGARIISRSIMINALPLFLVKPLDSKGELKASNAPVSLSDIPATVFSELRIPVHSTGTSVFKIGDREKRVRRYVTYKGYSAERDKYDYVQEWLVSDYGWLANSWKPGIFFSNKGLQTPEIHPFGVPIHFGGNGNASAYVKDGWIFDRNFSWIWGTKGTLQIPIPRAKSDLVLAAFVGPFRPAQKFALRKVEVYIDSEKFADWDVSVDRWYVAWIPKEKSYSKNLQVSFFLPDVPSKTLTNPKDEVPPGMWIRTLYVKEIQPYKLGTPIDFHSTGSAREYLVRGWNRSKVEFTWTLGKEAVMRIPVPNIESDLILSADVIPYLAKGKLKHQRLEVKVNQKSIAKLELAAAGNFSVVVPKNSVTNGFLELLFELPDAISPQQVEMGDDPTLMAFAFRTMRLEKKHK